MKRKLELKDIAGYLPHELKVVNSVGNIVELTVNQIAYRLEEQVPHILNTLTQ